MIEEVEIECHDCGEETTILLNKVEKETDDIQYCPHCGSNNIYII